MADEQKKKIFVAPLQARKKSVYFKILNKERIETAKQQEVTKSKIE